MDQIKIGSFIARCRKEKKLSQAELAEKLNISDRAVSKWETGKNMPDSSIMLELCEILGITVNELLCGEKIDRESAEKKAEENLIALKRKDERHMTMNGIAAVILSAVLGLGIAVCLICNIAISGRLSWSLIPIASIAFAWVISFPGLITGKKGNGTAAGLASLTAFSIFIIPYLFLLSRLIGVREVFTVGAVMAAVLTVFLWAIAWVFCRIGKKGRAAAFGISFLLAVPFVFIVNLILSKMIGEAVFDIWDMLTVFILLISAFVSFFTGAARKQ